MPTQNLILNGEKNMRKTVFVVMLAALLLAACGPVAGGSEYRNSLSVTGVGQVSLAPDIAYVSVGVRTESSDVSTAVSENAAEVQKVMAVLRNAGVEDKDLQTNNFSVYSNDQYDFEGNRSGTLYNVDNTVYVTVRDLSRLGELLDDAVGAGANSIWGVQFDISDRSAAESEARDMAVAEAQTQAKELAVVADVTLGDVITVSYSPSGDGFYYPQYGVGGGGAADQASTSIIPGLINISVSVSLTYEIR